jgi:hypothetical protein
VHRQHDADRQAGNQNQRCGTVAELKDMAQDFARLVRGTDSFEEGPPAKRGDRADDFQDADSTGADPVDQRQLLNLHCSQLGTMTLRRLFNTARLRVCRRTPTRD